MRTGLEAGVGRRRPFASRRRTRRPEGERRRERGLERCSRQQELELAGPQRTCRSRAGWGGLGARGSGRHGALIRAQGTASTPPPWPQSPTRPSTRAGHSNPRESPPRLRKRLSFRCQFCYNLLKYSPRLLFLHCLVVCGGHGKATDKQNVERA